MQLEIVFRKILLGNLEITEFRKTQVFPFKFLWNIYSQIKIKYEEEALDNDKKLGTGMTKREEHQNGFSSCLELETRLGTKK